VTGGAGPGNLTTASASVARRLSRAELANVVRDVLGDDTGAAEKFLSEDVYRPFDNDYTVQHASGALIESLEALATDIADRVMLQDPEVPYRIETGTSTGQPGIYKLDSYEAASRLSFLLWGSGPDDALLDQAKAGALLDGASRATAAIRLLGDARARQQLERF